MIYSILFVTLIWVSRALDPISCINGVADCSALAIGAQALGEALACDDKDPQNPICTVECNKGQPTCDSAQPYVGVALICDTDSLCREAPAPAPGTTDPAATTPDPCAELGVQDLICGEDTDCDFIECMDEQTKATLANTEARCVSDQCTVTCVNDEICSVTRAAVVAKIAGADAVLGELTCQDAVCALPPATTNRGGGGSTEAPVDLSCDIPDDCAAKLQALGVNADPAIFNEHFECVDNKCTVSCGNLPDICGVVEDKLNEQVDPHVTLACVNAVCVDVSGASGTDPPSDETSTNSGGATTDNEDDCNNPVSYLNDDDCEAPAPTGQCSVQFVFNVDVCVLNRGFTRPRIKKDIEGACRYIVDSAGGVCDGGEIIVTDYECTLYNNEPFYIFDKKPADGSQCPANIDKYCTNENKVRFAANIGGTVGVYCPCEDKDDLKDIKKAVEKTVAYLVEFEEEASKLSIADDVLCASGFGRVEANSLVISVVDQYGNVIREIDLTGNARQKYYYMASFVVFVVLSFL